MGYRIAMCLTLGLACWPGWSWGQKVNTFPKPDDPLHVRMDMYDELTRGNHWNEGTVMQHVIFPPAGLDRPLMGSQEDVAGVTAIHLAAYAHRYAVTQDPQVRKWADELMGGILKLEAVTGIPGCVARSFNKTDKPLWHEQVYFFPFEWHESKSMPGYRWEGDLSSDKFTDFCYAVSTYYDICADDEHKKLAADFIDRFLGRCVDNNFRLMDYDNKMTLWGNFCPDLPHENLNALEMLAGLRTAYHMTGKARYIMAYHMLIDRYGYDDQAVMTKFLWPEEWTVPWDDELASKSLYQLFRYETDPDLLQKYRMALNRHWFKWKDSKLRAPMDVWYRMLYEMFGVEGVKAVDDKTVEAIKALRGIERKRSTFRIPTPEGVKDVESEEEGNATESIHSYWFGRHYGFVDPSW